MFHLFSIGQMLQLRIVQGSARETAQSRQHSLSSVSHSMFGVSAKKAYSDQCLFICVVSRILEANVSAARRCYVATWLLCGSRCSSPQLRGLGYPGIQRFRQFKQEKSASLIQVLTWVKRRIQLSFPVPQTVNFGIYIVQKQAWVSEPCTKWCFWDKEIITPGSDGLDSRSSMPGCQIWVQSAKFRFAWWLHIDRWTWRPVLGLSWVEYVNVSVPPIGSWFYKSHCVICCLSSCSESWRLTAITHSKSGDDRSSQETRLGVDSKAGKMLEAHHSWGGLI